MPEISMSGVDSVDLDLKEGPSELISFSNLANLASGLLGNQAETASK